MFDDADMTQLCRQVVEELQAVAQSRPIDLQSHGDGSGRWDRDRLLQALSNLASNAVQHGLPHTPIRLVISGEPDQVIVTIHNHGAIPPDLLPKIFDPFRSGREKQRRGSGLGLGLFIAKAIASAHGGDIEVASSAEEGTRFRLVLPRSPAVVAA